ncbi:MAG: hypothetical protein PCFJNLEI_00960 [Verrucomicrobiae bacterium]|nr:hypothetical protein [Verrucomicrobiae bacterium]
MKWKNLAVLVIGVVAVCRTSLADTNGVYSLDQFGPVATAEDAEMTFQKAVKDIITAGGGVIMVPAHTAANWRPINTSQEQVRQPAAPAPAKRWFTAPGVTVIDGRAGTVKVHPPQASGFEFNRVLDIPAGQSLPFWGYFPVLSIKNTILHGSTSYRDGLLEDVEAGKDRRFYVKTIRGIFPGMFVSGSYGDVQRLYVKSLGYDKEKHAWYFVADTDAEVSKNDLLGNKNHVNVLKMDTYSHNENQTFDLMLWRHNYSQGDNYLVDARFKYMGDVHSTGGDENGVIYAAFIESLLGIFRGEVESWNPATQELKYKNAPSVGKTLGSGRPIINLNPKKWVTGGSVRIVRPGAWTEYGDPTIVNPVFEGKTYPTEVSPGGLRMGGLIRFSADAPVTDEVVGRYFAVDEADEHVPASGGIRRWYLIHKVTKNADGTKDMEIIRHWWGAKPAGAPTLYKVSNYTMDGHDKPLKYIIAPGANAYDVSDGVNNLKALIKLVPTPFTGTPLDFAANDPIEQAIGPDPFKPIPFRAWMWDKIPGAFPSPVFDINNGGVMRDSVLLVQGGGNNIDRARTLRGDQNPPWNNYLAFNAPSNDGIKFGADTVSSAILFTQPNNRVQPIKWYFGATNQPPQVATLTVSRETGDFNFSGGLITGAGLSGGDKPARNLRGKNVAVPAGQAQHEITFPVAEADGDYAVFIEQTWIGQRAIVQKGAKGFTVQFEKPAPAGAKLDWLIVR